MKTQYCQYNQDTQHNQDRQDTHKSPDNQGAVLIIVLLILAGLATITLQVSKFVFYDHALARLANRAINGKILAESAENLSCRILQHNIRLISDDKDFYSLEELELMWQEGIKIHQNEDFSVDIIDENSYFPLNNIFVRTEDSRKNAVYHREVLKNILVQLMFSHGYNGTEETAQELAEDILDAILTWGDDTGLTLETTEEYIQKELPCLPPKRPFVHAKELNLIAYPDMDEKLLYNILNGTGENKGLIGLVSVYTNGPMNIVQLDPIIVEALCADRTRSKEFRQRIVNERKSKEKVLENDWYREIFESFGGELPDASALNHFSRMFRIITQIGNNSSQNTAISICKVFDKYVKWYYRTIQ